MIMQIKNMSYGDARYIILKSLDTRDEIGIILLNDYPQLLNTMGEVSKVIESAMSCGDGGLGSVQYPDFSIIYTLKEITNSMPSYMLRDFNCMAWEDFLNAWLCICDNFCDIIKDKVTQEPENRPEFDKYLHSIIDIQQGLGAIIRLITVGLSYIDLINATSSILDEVKTWKDSRPTSLRLSEAYLQALDFYKEK